MTKTVDGVTFTCTHSGQKKAYGDTFREFDVSSDLPADQVEIICRTKVYAAIPHAEWQADYRKPGCSMSDAFRPHCTFSAQSDGKYRYVVTELYTD